MSFVAPIWDSVESHYVIRLLPQFSSATRVLIKKDTSASTVFANPDAVENIADTVIHNLIEDGGQGNWFNKLPSHDQLMKRVRHVFKNLAKDSENAATIQSLLLTPKQITFIWEPFTFTQPTTLISFDDSESEEGDDVEIPESDLPPVQLTDDSQQSHEDYLLTRLRAAKARVEAEQIRMQYFEATGRMPPDSEDEDE